MEAKTEGKLIYKLIPAIMKEVGAIEKTRKNSAQGTGYMFRGIDDIYNALHAPLSQHGVFYTPKVLTKEREERTSKSGSNLIYTVLTVEFIFYASDGSSVSVVTVGEAMDSGDKSCNKAMSAALKYALVQVFCIPTNEDADTENHSHEVTPRTNQNQPRGVSESTGLISEAQVKRLWAIAKSKNVGPDQVATILMAFGYQEPSTSLIRWQDYNKIIDSIERVV